jgi:hypothetical protein
MAYSDEILADTPVMYLRMHEASGDPQDSSGNGNHVTTTDGTPTYQQTGPLLNGETSYGIALDGSTEGFAITDAAELDVGDVCSLECWFLRANDGGGTRSLINWGSDRAQMALVNDAIVFAAHGTQGIAGCTHDSTDLTWHHLVMTKDGATIKVYLDGVDRTTGVADNTFSSGSVTRYVGRAPAGTERFLGSLSEVAVYDYALSAARVLAHYEAAFPAITGTEPYPRVEQVDGDDGDGFTTVYVPDDCDYVVLFASMWDGNASSHLGSAEIDNDAFTELGELPETGDASAITVAVLANPSTGAQTFEWTWSNGGSRSEGGEIALVYVINANLADPVRDSGVDNGVSSDPVSVTVDTELTDLVLAFAQSFDGGGPAQPGLDGTPLVLASWDAPAHSYDVRRVTPGSGSLTVNMSGESYSSMAVIALKQEEAAPGVVIRTPARRRGRV